MMPSILDALANASHAVRVGFRPLQKPAIATEHIVHAVLSRAMEFYKRLSIAGSKFEPVAGQSKREHTL